MRADIDFIWYLVNGNTGLCRYKDINGITQETPIYNTAIDSHLKTAPGRWMNQRLGFPRNEVYDSMLRAYSDPILFVKDSAEMIQELVYEGIGIENNFQLICFKRNPSGLPTTYSLYSKMNLDLSTFVDSITEGIEVSLIEGGLAQLLKAYENTMFEIPCDGSIPENIKLNLDGLVVGDTFNYEMIKGIPNFGPCYYTIPATFLNNEGDNFGVIHNDPQLQATNSQSATVPDGFFAGGDGKNPNFLYQSETEGVLEVEGDITVTGYVGSGTEVDFGVFLATDQTDGINADPTDAGLSGLLKYMSNSVSLVPNKPGQNFGPIAKRNFPDTTYTIIPANSVSLRPTVSKTFPFKGSITLKANEKCYLTGFQNCAASGGTIINSGNFRISFTSSALPTRVWGITWFDLFKLLIKEINQAASNQYITYNYGFQSTLLARKLNMFLTSGDAIAASGDSNYSRFFSIFQLDPQPSNNLLIPYGPNVKTCLKDCFNAASAVFCCSLGIAPQDNDMPDNIYVEQKQYTYNQNGPTMDIGEVGEFKIRLMNELMFNGIKVGYTPQTYDQKAGKYETNTTAEFISNLKSLNQKYLEIKCPYRTDAYGIEVKRSGTQSDGSPSTTRNGGDNDVFIINTNTTASFNDYQLNSFTSAVTDFNLSQNTNIKLLVDQACQGLDVNAINGSYYSLNNGPQIFAFSDPTLSNTSKNIDINYAGNLLGSPFNPLTGLGPDWVKIDVLINGIIVDTYTVTSTAATVPVLRTVPTITRNCNLNDNIMIRMSTSLTAGGQMDNVEIFVTNADTSQYWDANGQDIPIEAGVPAILFGLPNTNAINIVYRTKVIPVMSTNFQFFQFNSLLGNSNFTPTWSISNITSGDVSETVTYILFKNGIQIDEITFNGTSAQTLQVKNSGDAQDTMVIGDVYYILAQLGNMFAQVTAFTLNFESTIGVRSLYRVQYDHVDGIPALVFDANNNPVWNTAGCPYNIEELTPKRLAMTWWPYIRSVCYNQSNSSFLFSSLSKNQYLSTTLNGVTIKENAEMPIGMMPDGFFLPFEMTTKVKTPNMFAETMTGAASCLITGSYYGFPIRSFPNDVQQQPALNESQEWKLRPTYNTDITKLINLPVDGLKNLIMEPNSIFSSFLNSVKCVPMNQTLDPKYRTPDPDLFLYSATIGGWLNQKGYSNPWYVGYGIPLQFFTNGLITTVVKLYNNSNKLISTTVLPAVSTNALPSPILTVQGIIPTTGLTPGCYYFIVNSGGIDQMISECINLMTVNASDRILLIAYKNSQNKNLTVFDAGFEPCFYVRGFNDNKGKPDYVGAFFVDQPQDYIILNGIPYRTRELWIGMEDGVPDYVIEKINAIMQLDTIFIEGVQYTLDQAAKYESSFFKGSPKKFWKMSLRLAKNNQGITASAGNPIIDSSLAFTVNGKAFAANASNISRNPNPAVLGLTITT